MIIKDVNTLEEVWFENKFPQNQQFLNMSTTGVYVFSPSVQTENGIVMILTEFVFLPRMVQKCLLEFKPS